MTELKVERMSAHRSLVRARALALARLGRHAEAIAPLIELVAERPRDEELLLELLRSEAATAGPSTTLTRYEAYRSGLRDELGTDPGADLPALHRELCRARHLRCGEAWHMSRTRCWAGTRTTPRSRSCCGCRALPRSSARVA